jgi:hypothetical protein
MSLIPVHRARRLHLIGLVCVGVWLTSRPASLAEEPASIQSFVEAGEFAPALAAAGALDDPARRDQWLGRIAAAQANAASPEASWSTLSAIRSDLQRRSALDSFYSPRGAAGGAAMADFDTLIELITSTIAPDTWDEVGGAGAIEPFPTGVFVDADGVLKRLSIVGATSPLDGVRRQALADSGNRQVGKQTPLRKISLTRLEKQLQLRAAFGQTPDESMQQLAGMYRVRYVLVYPETGDVVIAGPAGAWRPDSEGRLVNVESGQPVLNLDDLLVVLRNAFGSDGRFGCAIKPREANLTATKLFLEKWKNRSVAQGQRQSWLEKLRETVGKQDIEVSGIDPRTRAARILVEADYRMKLVGMGLEDGTLGVVSYLDAVKRTHPHNPPAMNVLRWWFTLNNESLKATERRDAFELAGQSVRVLSENEMLSETGKRIHTGKSDELNSEFARSFTKHFDTLAAKYPVYADLRNIFDLALVAAVLRAEDLPGQADWHMTHFRDSQACPVTMSQAPQEVDSVINHVEIKRSQFVAGVSGGVSVDTSMVVRPDAIQTDDYGLLKAEHAASLPKDLGRDDWWWD